jgi:ParB family chromosome partitioning protein
LARTIAEQGLLQPLGVISVGPERYRVVYGNRRREAAIQLDLERVPCILLDAEDPNLLLRQLIENVQRQELNDMEKARAFVRLRERIAGAGSIRAEGELDEAIGKEVGLTGRTVRRYLGLLDLPEEIQQLIRNDELNVTQAQHLRRIPNQRTQIELAREAAAEGLSAADLSRLSAFFVANPNQTVESALHALMQGEEVRESFAPDLPGGHEGGGPLPKLGGTMAEDADRDEDFWADEAASEDEGAYLSVDEETIENQPKNKARVFRLRSLDQMVDETDRLARAYAEGDLEKWIKKDENASFKLRLLLKQIETLSRGLRELALREGWDNE